MKTNKLLQFVTLFICAISFALITSCEGPQGPAGPAGPQGDTGAQGPAGEDGTDGTDGVSGSAECLECHSSEAKYLVTQQYEGSSHAESAISGFAESGTGCQMCHTNEGFIEWMWSGEDAVENSYNYPTRISCTTCHGWHNESFETAETPNYALRANGPVDLLMYRSAGLPAVEVDLGGNGNLCINCHQPRRSWQGYEASDDNLGDGTYDQGSTHFGPHHGPQAASFSMEGAADVGTTAFPTTASFHARELSCTDCHMFEQNHTFEPELESCNTAACHNGGITTLDENSRQLAVKAQFEELTDSLTTAGLFHWVVDTVFTYHPDHDVFELDSSFEQKPGIYPIGQVGALYNWEWLHDDKSYGVHNFAYIEAMLTKSLEEFD